LFVALNVVICHVTFDFLKDLGNKKKVFDHGIIAEGGSEDLVVKFSVPQDVDRQKEILRPSRKHPSDTLLKFHVLQQGPALLSHMANLCRRGNLSC